MPRGYKDLDFHIDNEYDYMYFDEGEPRHNSVIQQFNRWSWVGIVKKDGVWYNADDGASTISLVFCVIILKRKLTDNL